MFRCSLEPELLWVTVGLGILPAVLRNPAATAMEVAALARLFPGRVVPGLGHGVAAWRRIP